MVPLYLFFLLLLALPFLGGSKTNAFESSLLSLTCNGSIAECNEEEYEMLMESDISRRFLEEKKYISPGALKKDQPVCGGAPKGEAYSKAGSCLPPPSNPPSRGCSKYYRCRDDI